MQRQDGSRRRNRHPRRPPERTHYRNDHVVRPGREVPRERAGHHVSELCRASVETWRRNPGRRGKGISRGHHARERSDLFRPRAPRNEKTQEETCGTYNGMIGPIHPMRLVAFWSIGMRKESLRAWWTLRPWLAWPWLDTWTSWGIIPAWWRPWRFKWWWDCRPWR